MAEYLEEEEVQKVIESAPTIQKKTFLACLSISIFQQIDLLSMVGCYFATIIVITAAASTIIATSSTWWRVVCWWIIVVAT